MTDIEHAKKYAEESISLSISMYNPKAEIIAETACLYGLTYKNKQIAELEAQIEKMKCCQNCLHLCARCELGIDGCYVCSKWELRR